MILSTKTATELIAGVAANQLNAVLVKRELISRGEYPDVDDDDFDDYGTTPAHANLHALGRAVEAAAKARRSTDGYFEHQ